MSDSKRKLTAAILIAAMITAAVALIAGNPGRDSSPGGDLAGAGVAKASFVRHQGPRRIESSGAGTDDAAWDPEDGPDQDAAAFADPLVRSLRVRVVGQDGAPAFGVPVAILDAGDGALLLAGPKFTNADGRVRFPIDVAMDQRHEVLVAARAVPGRAAAVPGHLTLDRATDVTLAIDAGVRALVQVVDPDGRPLDAVARVRKAILEDGAATPEPLATLVAPGARGAATESGPRAEALAQVFAETTPRAVRTPAGLELLGLRAPDEVTLFVSAPRFAPVYRPLRVPEQPQVPFPVEVKLEVRTSAVQFEVALPPAIEKDHASFSCHRVEGSGVVLAAGSDDVPAQKSPRFCVDLAPDDAQKLEVCAWLDGRIQASAEIEVPALHEGEVFDGGRVALELLPVVLAGHVVGEDHAPLANATVEAIGRGRTRDLAATTGADGAFSLRAPSGRGPYQVSAHAAGRVSEKLAGVAEPARDLRFVLDMSGSIEGAVLAPGASHVSVRAWTDGRAPFATSVKPGGSFVLSGLPRGVYTVVFEGDEIVTHRVTDVVVTPPDATHDARLERLRLRGRPLQGQP
jgi:hypothetical protein